MGRRKKDVTRASPTKGNRVLSENSGNRKAPIASRRKGQAGPEERSDAAESESSSSSPSNQAQGKLMNNDSMNKTNNDGMNSDVDEETLDKCWLAFQELAGEQELLAIDGVRQLLRVLDLWPSLQASVARAATEQLVIEAIDASWDGGGLTFDECAALLPRARALLTPLGTRLATLARVDEGVALCAAAAAGSTTAVRQLLAGGALPTASDYTGRTALHLAASGGHDTCIQALVAAGADPNQKDQWGWTPSDCSMQSGRLGTFNLLTRLGGAPAHFSTDSSRKGIGGGGGAVAPFHLWRKIWLEIVALGDDDDDGGGLGGPAGSDPDAGDGDDSSHSSSVRRRSSSTVRRRSVSSGSVLGGSTTASSVLADDNNVPTATLRGVTRWLALRGLRPARTRSVASNAFHQIGMGSLPLSEELRQLSLKASLEGANTANALAEAKTLLSSASGRKSPGLDSAVAAGRKSPGLDSSVAAGRKSPGLNSAAVADTPSDKKQTPIAIPRPIAVEGSSKVARFADSAARVIDDGSEPPAQRFKQPQTPVSPNEAGTGGGAVSSNSPLAASSVPPSGRPKPSSLSRGGASSFLSSRQSTRHGGTAPGTNMAQVVPYSAFRSMLLTDTGLLAKAAGSRLAVPDWSQFCKDIERIFEEVREDVPETRGANADYIPELAEFDPALFAVSVVTVDGQTFSCGDASVQFPIESCSKPFTYALVCEDLGIDTVHKFVGREPSGVAFNSFQLNKDGHPHNACINAGAMMTCSLFHRLDNMAARFNKLSAGFTALSGGLRCGFNQAVYLSEKSTAHRNFALAYFMKQHDGFPRDSSFMESVDLYFEACSIDVTNESLASMAATLANNGVSPLSGQRILSPEVVKSTLSLLSSCGMYDYSGEWATTVGVPAKSGVSGCIYLVVPNKLAISIWSPPLDPIGNSVRGIEFCKRVVHHFKCSLLDIVFEGRN